MTGRLRDREWWSARLYLAGWRVVRLLPARVAYGGARRVAAVVHRRGGRGVTRLRGNLSRVLDLPEDSAALDAVVAEGVARYVEYWVDAFRLPDWSDDEVDARVRVEGAEHLAEAVRAGTGIVVPLPHMGNWDLAGAWASRHISPVMTVAERLRPEELYQRFVAFREQLGMTILPLTGADTPVTGPLAAHLRAGGLVCLVADRDLSHSGVPVTMAGHPTRMPAGPATLARRTGATLLPTVTRVEGEGPRHRLVVEFHPPVTARRITDATQQVADVFADAIRRHPAHWHMLQRYFLADDEPSRAVRPG